MRRLAALIATASVAVLGTALAASPARAGEWVQVSCVNPNGSAAPSQGWTAFNQGNPVWGGNDTQCAPGSPMAAYLGNQATDSNGQSEVLEYVPPAGSQLIGGSLDATLSAYGGGTYSRAAADVLEPQDTVDQSDAVFLCVEGVGCGPGGGDAYSGMVTLPAGRGGDLFVTAMCTALTTNTCNSNVGGDNGYWALAQVHSADLLLSNSSVPTGTSFSGSVLQGTVEGTAHLVFTAADPGGPGVYAVGAAIDGRSVWAGTPNTNGGACVPVGSSGGALMFDAQQPCPAAETVDLPIPTAQLSPGSHELTVTVTDAAGNTATVLDQTITTPQTTPRPRGRRAIHARFVITWSWSGAVTRLRSIAVDHLPRAAAITVWCTGRRCPHLRPRRESARRARRLFRTLSGRRFHAGERLHITVTEPRRHPERILLTFRAGRLPAARLLRR